jgi:hypothetical protein
VIGGFQVGPFQTNYQQARPSITVADLGGSWEDFVKAKAEKNAPRELRKQERQLKKVEKKIQNAYKQIVVRRDKTEGILANLHRLEARKEEIVTTIQQLKVEFNLPDFSEDDDLEILLLDS